MKARFSLITLVVLLVAGMTLFTMQSCDKVKDATAIKVKYKLPDRTFTIDSLTHLKTEQLLYSQTFNVPLDSILGANNNGLLGNVTFYLLQATVVSPAWVTLDWVSSGRITVTPANGAPIEVATTTSIDPLTRTINFQVKNLDIASSINGPFTMDMYGNLTGPIPTGSIQMLLTSGIEITINPLGK